MRRPGGSLGELVHPARLPVAALAVAVAALAVATVGRPSDAFDALLERVPEPAEDHGDAVVMPPGDGPAYRRTVFGSGWSLPTLRVDNNTEPIRIFDPAWRWRSASLKPMDGKE
jgi:hypothetical protein